MVHEVEIDMEPESQEGDTEIVSINSVHVNKKQSSITAKLQMQVGKVLLEVPYKIDTGSERNIMPLYIFRKLFVNIGKDQLKRLVKGNIKLKTYNGTHIMQLDICAVQIKFKNVTKKCMSFVVPGNGQALLGMPDAATFNLINLNIDSIQTLTAECKTNKKQETHTGIMACTNTSTTRGDGTKNNSISRDNKQNTNGHSQPGDKYISINYSHSLNNVDTGKKSSNAMMQKIHT